jgi:hypothetical protein
MAAFAQSQPMTTELTTSPLFALRFPAVLVAFALFASASVSASGAQEASLDSPPARLSGLASSQSRDALTILRSPSADLTAMEAVKFQRGRTVFELDFAKWATVNGWEIAKREAKTCLECHVAGGRGPSLEAGRNTVAPPLVGLGLIEAIAERDIADWREQHQLGRVPIAADGRIGKFGRRGTHSSLLSFLQGALVTELGVDHKQLSERDFADLLYYTAEIAVPARPANPLLFSAGYRTFWQLAALPATALHTKLLDTRRPVAFRFGSGHSPTSCCIGWPQAERSIELHRFGPSEEPQRFWGARCI